MQPTSLQDVRTQQVRLRVATYGEGGPSVLLLHSFFMTQQAWAGVVPDLSLSFRVVTPDFPGFGESEKPAPMRFRYQLETFAECTTDLLAALDLGRVHLVGHGMGGAVAIALAARHPELVERLVLVDPFVYPKNHGDRILHMPGVGAMVLKQFYGRSRFRRYFRDQIFPPHVSLPTAAVDGFYNAFNSPQARESASATLQALRDTRSVVAGLSRVSAPTLVLWGRHDAVYPVHLGQRLAREIGAERFSVLESGHAPHLETPAELARHILDFLAVPTS